MRLVPRMLLAAVLLSGMSAPARAGGPMDLRAPVSFDFSGSLELDSRVAPQSLKLADPAFARGGLFVDPILSRVKPETTLAAAVVPAAVPNVPPGPIVMPSPMTLTTKLAGTVRTLGEFKTGDWNALGAVALRAPDAAPAGAMVLPAVDVLRLSAPMELPRASRPLGSQLAVERPVEGGETGAAAMAEAALAVAEAQARVGRRGRSRSRSGEPLMVLPDFGTSSFQVGASFSLAGGAGNRIAFGDRPSGPFDQGLSSRQGFGLPAPGAGESLRLSTDTLGTPQTNDTLGTPQTNDTLGTPQTPGYEPATAPRSAKDDADKRLWTGVVFNF